MIDSVLRGIPLGLIYFNKVGKEQFESAGWAADYQFGALCDE